MITIFLVPNPFEPSKHEHKDVSFRQDLTPAGWVKSKDLEEGNKFGPYICVKNGLPLMREHWNTPLEPGDIVFFTPCVDDPVDIIIGIVVLIVAVVVSVALSSAQRTSPDVTSMADVKQADPVFTLRGQQNQNKLSQPIEKPYGRFRSWPSYGAAPYSKFINNDSWLFQLFCVGHGRYNIDQILIEDTPIEQFQDITYEIVEPGQKVTLFPDNVFTSTEVGGIELFGPNEATYTGATGGFAACPPLSTTELIECDILLPSGLYYSNDAGGLDPRTASMRFDARRIDDGGTALTDWGTIATFTRTLATNTPQRFTIEIPVPQGRYEVRAVRTVDADLSHRAADTIQWSALRAFLPSTQVYPGVTMLVVKAKASNNLNDSAQTRINILGTALVRVWTPAGVWIPDVATRSPVWAFCDVFTASYGGSLPDEFLDMPTLYALDQELAALGIFFDWVFEQKTTTWEAAKSIALICRAVPMLVGNKISMVRDRPQVLPAAVFNENNIVENSLSCGVKLREISDHDGLEIEYINPTTWQPETVVCLGPGDLGDNLKNVKVPGCTDRTKAFRIGMYMRMSELSIRLNVTFKTGMEGFIPSYGDLIAVNHSFPRWGQGGQVVAVSDALVVLSVPVTFTPGQQHYLLIRKADGSVFGPAAVSDSGVAMTLVLATPIVSAEFFVPGAEPPIFLFGCGTAWGKLVKIASLAPDGDETVTVKATNYTPLLFSYDDIVPPAFNGGFFIDTSNGTPPLQDLRVTAHPTDTSLIVLTWREVIGVVKYVINTSSDGINYSLAAECTTAFYVLPVLAGHLWISVQAIKTGAGTPGYWDGIVGDVRPLPADVTGVALASAFTGLVLRASWTPVANVDGYRVRVLSRPTGGNYTLARTVQTPGPLLEYFNTDALADGAAKREFRILVQGMNVTGPSANPAELITANATPAAATGLTRTILAGGFSGFTFLATRMQLSWTPTSDTDVDFFRVVTSPTSGFTTGDTVYQGSDTSCIIDSPGFFSTIYWRVLTKDKWGPELVTSSEATATGF